MRKSVLTPSYLIAGILASAGLMLAQSEAQRRLDRSADVLQQMTGAAGAAIPRQVLSQTQCVLVIPEMKSGAFLVGAQHGKGFASCRTPSGWTAPAPYSASGGSIGLQAGGQEQDLVLLLMRQNARNQLLQDKLKLGTTASVGAGSSAAAPKQTTADVLAYSHSSGVFAGVSVDGVSIHPDTDTLHDLYGPNVSATQVLQGQVAAPAATARFQSVLAQVAGGQ